MKRLVWLLVLLAGSVRAVTVTVTNSLDAGPGSLRQAVVDVNASVDPANKIQFNIPGPSPVVITFTSAALPPLLKQVTVDGSTQPGWSPNAAAVILTCPSMIVTGLTLAGPPSVIRGLRVQQITNSSFNSTGIGLTTPGHTVADCQIISNYIGLAVHSASNTIGGVPVSTNRNVISGNVSWGISVTTGAGFNVISGNLIGTDPTGTTAMGNRLGGIGIAASSGNLIGGTQGAETRNVISGNVGDGISVTAFSGNLNANNNVIVGNHVGVDITGGAAISNTSRGVHIGVGISNRVGGVLLAERNVISGNSSLGVSVGGTNTFFTIIQGNLIGPFADGVTAPPAAGNQTAGIQLGGAVDTMIGGMVAGARNVISGNKTYGINMDAWPLRTTVAGNFVGVQSNGTAVLPNAFVGILIGASSNTLVRGNVVAGNVNAGIYPLSTNAVGVVIQANFVGTDKTGTLALPNGQIGIRIDGANGVLVGGTNSGDGNVIAYNLFRGASVITNTPGGGVRNSFLGNLIYSNQTLGLDLGLNGATPNDVAPDADTGANNLQNFPVIISATQGSTAVQGVLVSAASQTYRCEFFATNVPQGMVFLGATNIITPASGTATFFVVLGGTAPTGATIVATATDSSGNTSELGTGANVRAALDADGDGMWDAWELANFASTTNTGSADNDLDGVNNYAEFVADTAPSGPGGSTNFFRFVALTNGLPHFPVWASSAARWYDIEYSTNLLSPAWSTLSANIVGTGGLQSYPDTDPATNRAYRIRVKVP